MRMKGIVIVAVMVLGGASFCSAADARDARPYQTAVAGRPPYRVVQIDAHRPVTYHFAVTNTTDKPQTVESVRTSCACLNVNMGGSRSVAADGRAVSPLTAADATGIPQPKAVREADALAGVHVPPGGVLPFDVEFNPAGMEGLVEKRVWVTLAPIGGSPGTARPTRIVTFDIAADVRLRLGFKPMDAAFGVIKRNDMGREIVAKLSGYVANGVTLGTPRILTGLTGLTGLEKNSDSGNPDNPVNLVNPVKKSLCGSAREKDTVFDVRLAPDGKSIVAKFRDRNVLPGIYSETWTIPTSDAEIPEIKFIVSARVADAVSVSPQVITVGWDEPVCSRMVMVRTVGSRIQRDRDGRAVSPLTAADATGCVPPLRILSAETKPRKWGDVKITQRPMNGWRIDIEHIDPREVRQFSKRPFLEVKTNLPGMETFEIPLRVVIEGDSK